MSLRRREDMYAWLGRDSSFLGSGQRSSHPNETQESSAAEEEEEDVAQVVVLGAEEAAVGTHRTRGLCRVQIRDLGEQDSLLVVRGSLPAAEEERNSSRYMAVAEMTALAQMNARSQ